MTICKEKQIVVIHVQNHAQHEHSMASGNTVGNSYFAVLTWHSELSRMKKKVKKKHFQMDKTQNKNKKCRHKSDFE